MGEGEWTMFWMISQCRRVRVVLAVSLAVAVFAGQAWESEARLLGASSEQQGVGVPHGQPLRATRESKAWSGDEVLVGFQPGTSELAARQILASAGVTPVRWLPRLAVMLARGKSPADPTLATVLNAQRRVRYVEPNYLLRGDDVPNDTYYSSYQWAPPKIGAESAWSMTHGSAGVQVAVLDSGLDMQHSEFSGKYASGYDFVNDDGDPTDDHGHGTHVSGIVGALTNNSAGVAAIGWNTSILPVKVLDQSLAGTHADAAAGIEWAADHGADVINMSFGGSTSSQTLEDAVEYAYGQGVLLVASAGNGATSNPYYPAAYPEVMAVAATTSSDGRWSMSNYGSWLSMCAPGVSIYSTSWSATGGSGYASLTGTSQSAPHVSAVAALMLSVNGSLTNAELRDKLESTAVDLGDAGFDIYYGHGRVDAAAAVLDALPITPTPSPTPAPTATPTPTPAIHVGDLDGSAQYFGSKWRAVVTVAVHDAAHGAVSGARVAAAWSGGTSGSGSCTTGTDGRCSITSAKISRQSPSLTLTVTNVTKSGRTYDASANHDPDGDSTGTAITVNA